MINVFSLELYFLKFYLLIFCFLFLYILLLQIPCFPLGASKNLANSREVFRGASLQFIQPGRPSQNGFMEAFTGRVRDECLNEQWFGTSRAAKDTFETRRKTYNNNQPHLALDWASPTPNELISSCSKFTQYRMDTTI